MEYLVFLGRCFVDFWIVVARAAEWGKQRNSISSKGDIYKCIFG